METLEPLAMLSADLKAVFVDALAPYAIPGKELSVEAKVANLGSTASGRFTVEYRLSTDPVIDTSDLLIETRTVLHGLAAGATTDWTQTLRIPATVPHNHYNVGIIVETGSGRGMTASTLAELSATSILATSLSGTVVYNGQKRSVAIRSYLGTSTPIYDDRPTWIVIHGRDSSPSSPNLVQLEKTLAEFSPNDQVLVLNWSQAAASGDTGWRG